jgi:hypothetical protein
MNHILEKRIAACPLSVFAIIIKIGIQQSSQEITLIARFCVKTKLKIVDCKRRLMHQYSDDFCLFKDNIVCTRKAVEHMIIKILDIPLSESSKSMPHLVIHGRLKLFGVSNII